MGFGGGTQTFFLGVCTQSPSKGPMSHTPIEWGVRNNTNSNKPDKTPPLIPIAWARENKIVFDFDTGRFLKDNPDQVYSAKAGRQSNGQIGKKSYWLIPLTSRAFKETQTVSFQDLPDSPKQAFHSVAEVKPCMEEDDAMSSDTPPFDAHDFCHASTQMTKGGIFLRLLEGSSLSRRLARCSVM